MAVIAAVTFYLILKKGVKIEAKISLVIVCALQGIARIKLNYHTLEQVFGGIVFGVLFAYFYFKCFDLVWLQVERKIPQWIPITDDTQIAPLGENEQSL